MYTKYTKKSTGCKTCCLMIACCVVSLLAVGVSAFVLWRLEFGAAPVKPHIHLVIDNSKMDKCKNTGREADLPCFTRQNIYLCKEGNYGPLKCLDDFFDQEGGVNSCQAFQRVFRFNGLSDKVEVLSGGLYRFYGQVSFKDKEAAPVMAAFRINNHNWIQCHQHNHHAKGIVPYTTCALGGERRLRRGDRVALYLGESFRSLNAYHKVTFWGLVRLSD